MAKLVVYVSDSDEAKDKAALNKLKKLKIKYDVKKLSQSEYAKDIQEFKKTTGEDPTPLFCLTNNTGESKCTLIMNDIIKLHRKGVL